MAQVGRPRKETVSQAQFNAKQKELDKLTEQNQKVQEQMDAMSEQYQLETKKAEYYKGYYNAALSNLGDQLTALQRQVQIVIAGGRLDD